MANRRFQVYEIRQVLVQMRGGASDRVVVSMGVKFPPFGETKFPPLVVKRPRLSTPPGCVTEVPPFSFPSAGHSLP